MFCDRYYVWHLHRNVRKDVIPFENKTSRVCVEDGNVLLGLDASGRIRPVSRCGV